MGWQYQTFQAAETTESSIDKEEFRTIAGTVARN